MSRDTQKINAYEAEAVNAVLNLDGGNATYDDGGENDDEGDVGGDEKDG